jgi:hypothetical protein
MSRSCLPVLLIHVHGVRDGEFPWYTLLFSYVVVDSRDIFRFMQLQKIPGLFRRAQHFASQANAPAGSLADCFSQASAQALQVSNAGDVTSRQVPALFSQ